MSGPREVARAVEAIATAVTGASGGLGGLGGGPSGFGADAPGRLGELGRELHGTWEAALAARSREAAAAGARLADAAQALRLIGSGYEDVEAAARRRHATES
ncbi:hypothetical protein [Rhizomonospora bruguierae]|uniref:hypothetical protein n=1 Tax=Rhizomonospora bruguierae TaxID=1581705 RepID=UPI001BCC431F|nr:hypothetical protein [Micromonospora sp. NBRC 107566]